MEPNKMLKEISGNWISDTNQRAENLLSHLTDAQRDQLCSNRYSVPSPPAKPNEGEGTTDCQSSGR